MIQSVLWNMASRAALGCHSHVYPSRNNFIFFIHILLLNIGSAGSSRVEHLRTPTRVFFIICTDLQQVKVSHVSARPMAIDGFLIHCGYCDNLTFEYCYPIQKTGGQVWGLVHFPQQIRCDSLSYPWLQTSKTSEHTVSTSDYTLLAHHAVIVNSIGHVNEIPMFDTLSYSMNRCNESKSTAREMSVKHSSEPKCLETSVETCRVWIQTHHSP